MEAGDGATRIACQISLRGNDKEIHPHRIPFQLPQGGDTRRQGLTGHREFEFVTDIQIEGLRQTLLHGELGATCLALRFAMPTTGNHLVALRQVIALGKIEFALDQSLRAIIDKITGRHGAPIDPRQTTAHHRFETRLR